MPPGAQRLGQDNDLIEWDARTFALKSNRNLDSEVRGLAVSPDSKLMAVLTFEGVSVHEVGVSPPAAGNVTRPLSSNRGGIQHAVLYGRRDDPVQV